MKNTLTTLAACLAFSVGFGQNSNDPCDGVQADFTSENVPPAGGIQFTNTSQTNGAVYSSVWTFGNEQSSQDPSPFMVYDEGTYQVKLVITDANGCESTVEKDVTFSYGGH